MNNFKFIDINYDNMKSFLTKENIKSIQPKVQSAVESLFAGTCPGNNYLGWLELPQQITLQDIEKINKIAGEIKDNADHLILIGIGGSYLGARSAIEFMLPPFRYAADKVLYFGHHLSREYTNELINYILDKDVYVNVVSKSGGTTEPAVAFRLLLKALSKKYNVSELQKRIITTTDPAT